MPLTDAKVEFLSTPDKVLDALAELASWCSEWRMAVAWGGAAFGHGAHWQRLFPFLPKLRYAVVGLSFHQTEPWFLRQLYSRNVLRCVASATGTFHPKLYLFSRGDELRTVIGSPNFTASAFSNNVECATRTDTGRDSDFAVAVESFFARCMREGRLMTREQLDDYEEHYHLLSATRKDMEDLRIFPEDEPETILGEDEPELDLHPIGDAEDIARAEQMLADRFGPFISSSTVETVNYAFGSDDREVHWCKDLGMWFSVMPVEDRIYNSFGLEKPGSVRMLRITTEVNVALGSANTGIQGCFAVDAKTGDLWFVHRGGRIKRPHGEGPNFREVYEGPTAMLHDPDRDREVFAFGRLDDADLPMTLATFVRQIATFKGQVE